MMRPAATSTRAVFPALLVILLLLTTLLLISSFQVTLLKENVTQETPFLYHIELEQAEIDHVRREEQQLLEELVLSDSDSASLSNLNKTLLRVAKARARGCLKEPKPNPYNVAICAYGTFRVSARTVASFRRFVYKHLGKPDVFLYLNPKDDPMGKVLQDEFMSMVKQAVLAADVDYEKIRKKGGYSPCLDSKEPKDYNWNGGWPGSNIPKDSEVHQLRGAEECGRIIAEEETKRGFKYDWIILTRMDHLYLGLHPALRKLTPDRVWVPSGEDWGGINDRHSVFPRHLTEKRFAIHNDLMTGKYSCAFRDQHFHLNIEAFMLLFYKNNQILIGRYETVSKLGCTERKHYKGYAVMPENCYRYPTEARGTLIQRKINWAKWALEELEERAYQLALACSDEEGAP